MPLHFFNEFTFFKGLLYAICAVYVTCTAIAVVCEPFITLPCTSDTSSTDGTFPNVLYKQDPCIQSTRYGRLMGMTPQECTFGRHLVVAAILGSVIGFERRIADRPAGIRTMSLVSLAAALFTLNSTFVFMEGPMHWDPARVSAAVPSGVGFLGAGLMVKDVYKELDGSPALTIKGLNTAASVWLSAAVGVASGGGLYFVATYTTALLLVLLRFGPRTLVRQESVLGMGILPMTEAPPKTPPQSEKKETIFRANQSPGELTPKMRSRKPSMSFD